MAVIATLALALGASPVFAAQTHPLKGSFGTGELSGPGALAVNQGDGSVYVADSASGGKVLKFDSAGSPANFSALGSNTLAPEFPDVAQIAVGGPADNLYIANNSEQKLNAFAASGAATNFSASAPYISANSITGSPDGNFQFLCGTAVDADGAIYAGDYFQGIRVYAPSGELLTSIPTTNSCKLVVDSAGNLYVAGFGGNVSVWTPSTFPVTASTTYSGPTTVYEGGVTGIAVDPADDNLYVNGGSYVAQYDSVANGNAAVGQFGAEELAGGSTGVAIDRSGGVNDGDVYVSMGAQVGRFGPLVTVPGVSTGVASDLTASAATLNGTVDPDGIELSECKFEYGLTSAYGSTVPCAESTASIGSGSGAVSVHADISDLSGADYHFRLVAANTNGPGRGADAAFSIVSPPVIAEQSAEPDLTEASLRANVNPSNAATRYHFEFGSTAAYGQSTEERELVRDSKPRPVTALLSQLERGASYHFRLVATNEAGTSLGPDAVFTTRTGDALDSCPNAAIRSLQDASALAECRAYEQVSPADKIGQSLDITRTVQTSPSGDAVAYSVPGALPGAPTSLAGQYYLGRRGGASWSSEALDLPQANSRLQLVHPVLWLTPELDKAMQYSSKAFVAGANEGGANLYLHDTTNDQLSLAMTSENESKIADTMVPGTLRFPVFATSDLSHFYFMAREQLTFDAVPGANVYESVNGQVKLVSVLPDGTPVQGELSLTVAARGATGISDDGRRLLFQQSVSSAGDNPLYMRIDGDTTIAISASQVPGDSADPRPAFFKYMNPSGTEVYFSSPDKLTSDAPFSFGYGSLYRYDVQTGNLKFISEDFSGVLRAFDDGSFYAFDGSVGISIQHFDGEYFRQVAAFSPVSGSFTEYAASPDGRFLAFGSYGESPTGDNNTASAEACPQGEGKPAGQCEEVYLYDAASEKLTCISCNPYDGQNRDSGFPRSEAVISNYLPRTVSNDGVVIFQSNARLTPADVNGRRDVYRWQDGHLTLISPGTGNYDASFADASADGKQVFFYTRQGLVAQDDDGGLMDLYVSRIDGGLIGQNEARKQRDACEGESCKGQIGSLPVTPAATTSVFAGPGNTKRHKPKVHRGKHKKKKQKPRKHSRKPGHSRGGAR